MVGEEDRIWKSGVEKKVNGKRWKMVVEGIYGEEFRRWAKK